jgi:hypothetical protein
LPFIVFVGLFSLAFIGGGLWLLHVQATGERTTAKVTSCVHRRINKSYTDYCTGSWVKGGSLLEGGHVVIGTIDGADSGDIGKPIEVRLSGDRAYTSAKRLPIILLAIGGVFALGGGYELRNDHRRQSQLDSP